MEELLELLQHQPDNINARMELVKNYIDQQDYDKASEMLSEVLKLDPKHLDANYIFAQLYEFKEDFEKAAHCLEIVIEQQPVPELKYKLAQMYENIDRYEDALILYKECSRYAPDDNHLLENIAHVSRILGHDDEAIEYYKQILKRDPDNIVALTQMMELYEDREDIFYYVTKAKVHILEGNFSHAVTAYKKALAEADHEDDIIKIRLALADLFIQKETPLQAIDEYLAVLDLDNTNSQVYRKLADIYRNQDYLESACETYEKALELLPGDLSIIEELADIYIELENYPKAQELLERLGQKDPKNLSVQVNLAKVYIAVEKDNQAQTILNLVLAKEPKNIEAIGVLTDFHLMKKNYEKAAQYVEEIKKLIPQSPFGYKKAGEVYESVGKQYESHYNYGMYHDIKGEKQFAIDEFTWAFELSPQNDELAFKLAKLYEDISEEYIAIEFYQKAYNINKSNISALKKIADIYVLKKDYQQAIDYYNEILTVEDKNKDIYYNLADCYEQTKNYDKALETFRKCKTFAANSAWLEEVGFKIEGLENKLYSKEEEGLLSKIFGFFSS